MEIRELTKKEKYDKWLSLPIVYFSKWMWEVAVKKQPYKYSIQLPTYCNHRVVIT